MSDDSVTVKTNGHIRDLVSFWDIPEGERENFDYIDADDRYSTRLFEYRGSWYDVNEFEVLGHAGYGTRFKEMGWVGIQTDSYFSTVVIRWGKDWDGSDDYESVVVGYAHW